MSNTYGTSEIERHFQKYKDEYILLGLGIMMGIGLSAMFRRKPKIDEAVIISNWLESLVHQGYNVYALTNDQKNLWDSVWEFAERQVGKPGWGDIQTVLKQMVEDYKTTYGPPAVGY